MIQILNMTVRVSPHLRQNTFVQNSPIFGASAAPTHRNGMQIPPKYKYRYIYLDLVSRFYVIITIHSKYFFFAVCTVYRVPHTR